MSYIKLENLKKVYNNKVTAVKEFTLEIERGEFIVFLGPSGCGKSTTMRMIAGLETVTEGDILIEGKSIVNLQPKDRGISMIFQSYAVWPHMTVYDNIAYALKLRKMSKTKINETVIKAAEICNIREYLDRYPSQLSGGQRQRVAVARAIAIKSKLFLMDEPLSNLDAKLRVSMRTELKRIHQNLNSTSIFVTHDQSEALSLADRIVVMKNGYIEQIGTPNEIYHEPKTMFVAQFIGSPPSNLFKVKVEKKANKYFLTNKIFKFEVLKEDLKSKLDLYLNKTIILSIRPENITVNDKELFSTKINIVEPQGSHVVISVDVENNEVKIVSDKLNLKINQTVKLGFTDRYILFDEKTGQRIK